MTKEELQEINDAFLVANEKLTEALRQANERNEQFVAQLEMLKTKLPDYAKQLEMWLRETSAG